MQPLTPAELAAHFASFEKVQTVCVVYGLARERIRLLIRGQTPIYPGLELIYRLLTRYPDLMPKAITPQEYVALLAAHGVTQDTEAAALLGKQRYSLLNYLATGETSWLVTNLMEAIRRFLQTGPIQDLWAVVEDVKAHPPSGELLQQLEEGRTKNQVMELVGIEEVRYYHWRQAERLSPPLALLVYLLSHYPDTRPPVMTVAQFDAILRRHGIKSSARISTLLGRVRSRWYRYRSGRATPAGSTLGLMTLIARFLESHPLSEYEALVHEVAAARGFDLSRETWLKEPFERAEA